MDVWLREQIAKVTTEAKTRRQQHRAAAGTALKAMLDRGETLSAIAEQAEITVAKVRTYSGLAGGGAADSQPATQNGHRDRRRHYRATWMRHRTTRISPV